MEKLVGDVEGDPDVVDQFVSDYLSLLDDRMQRLANLLGAAESGESIRVLILSLETTSAMLGGTEVAVAARTLRTAVVAERPTGPAHADLVKATTALRLLLTSQEHASQEHASQEHASQEDASQEDASREDLRNRPPGPAGGQPGGSRRRGPSRRSEGH